MLKQITLSWALDIDLENMKNSWFIIFILGLLFSCKKAEDRTCFKGWGDQKTIEIPLDLEFDSLRIEDNMIVHLYQDTVNKMIVEGGSNVINLIDATFDNNSLIISDLNKCNFLRSYKKKIHVYLHYKSLSFLYYSGGESVIMENQLKSGEFRVHFVDGGGTVHCNVDVGYFAMSISGGAGDFTAQGQALIAFLKVQSNAYGDASELKAADLIMFNQSSGDLTGRVEEGGIVNASIHYKGDNYIYGKFSEVQTIDEGEGENVFE